jgi:NADH-quinone oxidoreductase subunit C
MPAPAQVADLRPLDAVTADGTPVPDDSSALARTRTDVADEVAARGDVAPASAGAADAPVAPDATVPAVDVHAEPSRTDAPGDDVAPSGSVATNPPVDAPTDLPAADAPAADAPAADAPAADVAPAADAPAAADVAPAADAPAGDAPDAAPAPEPEPEVVVVDDERQPVLDLLAEHLGEGLVATHVVPGKDMTVRVTRDAWVRTAEVCRDVLGMRYFGFLSAIDWMPSPYGRSEDGGLAGAGVDAAFVPADPTAFTPGTTGGDTRFQMLARLQAPVAPSLGITIKCDVPADDLVMPTWTTVFPGADWHERECAEMFGIAFAGHQHLVKLYLPGDFEGYPLRKDFPLLARDVKPWPGLVDVEAMPGEEPSEDDASVAAGAEEA